VAGAIPLDQPERDAVGEAFFMANKMITQERLKELLHYDATTGVFTRLIQTSSNAKKGSIAGSLSKQGYVIIWINNEKRLAHRLAWLYVYGEYTVDGFEIDHINRIKSDNRISNLRLATRNQNRMNVDKAKNNSSGYKGVCFEQQTQKWKSQIKHNGKSITLGRFSTKEDANKKYLSYVKDLHGEFFCDASELRNPSPATGE